MRDEKTYKIIDPQITQITRIKEMDDQRTYKIIGCAMEVHKELGCGFLEAVYQESLGREFKGQEIPFKSQPTIQISYKGRPLDKTYQPDSMVFNLRKSA